MTEQRARPGPGGERTTGAPRCVGAHHPTADAGCHDHCAWGYSSDDERAEIASEWLAAGLVSGQRAVYVGAGPRDSLLAELSGIAGVGAHLADGDLDVATSADVYPPGRVDAHQQLRTYSAAVDSALTAGYAGLRVAADITDVISDPGRRAGHLHWEQVADRLAVARPFSPLCLYDTRRVADGGTLPVVHPLNGPEQPPFTLSSTSVRAAALIGELDTFGADALAEVLEAMPTTDVLDVSALAFIDGSAARTLHGWLRRRRTAGDDIRVVGAGSLVRRTWDLCDLDPAALSLSA